MSSFRVPQPENEPVHSYVPGSPDHTALKAALAALKKSPLEIPLVIGGKAITTGKRIAITAPHNHELVLDATIRGECPRSKPPWRRR
jgi:1-pyrroline-5-carboxylate dehydrogenase